jgi:hypothetical protein
VLPPICSIQRARALPCIPPGTDVCTLPEAVCYSPDVPSTFRFCGYHGSVTFSDIGHILYSVEPYQNVPGCTVSGVLPNGVLIDSTATVLSHELFEIITDPDLDAWFDRDDLDLWGAEIGDICQRASFSYDTPLLNGRLYEIQPEYSNADHACVFSLTSSASNRSSTPSSSAMAQSLSSRPASNSRRAFLSLDLP